MILHPAELLRSGSPEAAITTLIAALAGALALWLAASWLAWVWELRTPTSATRRARIERFALPTGRRLAELTLAASAIVLPACSSATTTPSLEFAGTAPTTALSNTAPSSTAPSTTAPSATASSTTGAQPESIETTVEAPPLAKRAQPRSVRTDTATPATSHTVVPGDNLWSIAEQYAGNRPVAQIWSQIISANLDGLRSGNPDLIFPGEVVALPQ